MNKPPPEVLKLVNAARKVCGMKPLRALPKGDTGSENYCPLALALKTKVSGTHARFEPRYVDKVADVWGDALPSQYGAWLPEELSNFVEDFDDYVYPQLVRTP